MQVASLVRNTLGLNNHRVERVSHRDGSLVVGIELERRRLKGAHTRVWRVDLRFCTMRRCCGRCSISWSAGSSAA